MKVKMILPALTEAKSPYFRPIKYSLFPPLGLATLAAYLREEDEVTLQDEHVQVLDTDDEPDLVVIQVDITSARRAYALADHYRRKGAHTVFRPARMSGEALAAATGAPTAISTAGARSCAAPGPSRSSWGRCATRPTPAAGRSSSRSGTC